METFIDNTSVNATVDVSQQSPGGISSFVQAHTYLTSFLGFIVALCFLIVHFTPKVDSEEPPLVSHRIPFFGHLLGILKHGVSYFDKVRQEVGKPIFTLPVLNGKVYVIASPALVTACMRETRNLSFNPFIVEVFRRIAGLTHADMEITKLNMDDKSKPGYMTDMHRVEYSSLAPGPALDKMNDTVLEGITTLLQKTLPSNDAETEVDLYTTVRDIVSLVSLRVTYGPGNPFDKDPTLLADFWVFERNLRWLILNTFPAVTARKAHKARARLIAAFERYYEDRSHLQAAAVVRERYDVAVKYGQKASTVAAFDVGLCVGILANSIPTVFWMLMYIYNDWELQQALRDETAHLVEVDATTGEMTIDVRSDKHLRTACPLLTSTFHETLRVISSSLSSGRVVLHDTVLTPLSSSTTAADANDPSQRPYVLKAGNTIQIPSHSLHHPPSTTDPTASPFAQSDHATFNARRFMDLGPKTAVEPERAINGSFRAFGGGSTLCPGRKFAFVEVIGTVLVFLHTWQICGMAPSAEDIAKAAERAAYGIPPKKGMAGGPWGGFVRVPEQEDGGKLALAVAKPKGDVRVRVRRRPSALGLVVKSGFGAARETARVKVGNVGVVREVEVAPDEL